MVSNSGLYVVFEVKCSSEMYIVIIKNGGSTKMYEFHVP